MIEKVLERIEKEYPKWKEPVVTKMARKKKDPFKVLISCLLSLRTKDEVTKEASKRLFERAKTPEEMIKLSEEEIARLIYPVGFYNNKAKIIREISKTLLEKYGGKVPDSLEELLKLKGVGRKTANLVLVEGFDKPGICVDTHVHRICNRLGWVTTKTPEETEMALRKILPQKYWKEINRWFVAFGKTICKPVSPLCSQCPVSDLCPKIGATKSR
ncbi:endonuclease III [Thermosulfidibacter takaii ABI70S6]|uniref:Endonuclease III n=2 Tax=Thermosulfidibacter takaii TaxID=412593 RepID=A0A0S3QUS9_THET7|nr:endonuclease III [Thermosulfidibacter takaii ABI70S6]